MNKFVPSRPKVKDAKKSPDVYVQDSLDKVIQLERARIKRARRARTGTHGTAGAL